MIRFDPDGDVAVLRLDRPEKRNALTPGGLASLLSHLGTCHSARAVVLSGEGPVFCAGFDMALCEHDETALPRMLTGLSKVVAAMRGCIAPVVVSAQGAAVAGGCALVAAADIAVATADARLGYPVVKLGISPAVNAPMLSAAVGEGRARQRALDPGLIDGAEAVRIGLVAELADDAAACEARAIAIAKELAAKPRAGIAATKLLLGELDGSTDARAQALALQASMSLVGGEEQQRRVAALWKREPGKGAKA